MARRPSTFYLGVIVNPKTKIPVHVWWDFANATIWSLNEDDPTSWLEKNGQGYFGEDEVSSMAGYPRSHTPSGVTPQGMGYGTCLYTALCMAAHWNSEGNVSLHSEKGDGIASGLGRSSKASRWWEQAVELGLASEEEGGENEVDVEENDIASAIEDVIDTDRLARRLGWLEVTSVYITSRCSATGTKMSDEGGSFNVYPFSAAMDNNLVVFSAAWIADDVYGENPGWKDFRWVDLDLFGPEKEDREPDIIVSDALLALNVTDQPVGFVQMLTRMAKKDGAPTDAVDALVRRHEAGLDPSDFNRSGGSSETIRKGLFDTLTSTRALRNPRRRNPPLDRRTKRDFEELVERRAELGWTALENMED